ncbi:MAG: rRNA maturation RNase YbeY [Xanthomonadales bacterium]|jgi:probable rRNA maturation factor|nr:rRNA maturation RNase YbeY [Xanthomonadales bacterium]
MPEQAVQLSLSYGEGVMRRGLPAAASFRRWADALWTLPPARLKATSGLRHPRGGVALSLRLVGADEGRELNRQWRGKDYATNVLSFEAAPMPAVDGAVWIGDLVICAPVVAAEAEAQGKPLKSHYAHLTVHGLLHLLGLDHERGEADAAVMEALEITVLAELGVPDPYAEPEAR